LRRAEIGIHCHIAGDHLLRYYSRKLLEKDNRRLSNGEQVSRVAALSKKRGESVDFTGFWRQHIQ
jgi:hypothetical protein